METNRDAPYGLAGATGHSNSVIEDFMLITYRPDDAANVIRNIIPIYMSAFTTTTAATNNALN